MIREALRRAASARVVVRLLTPRSAARSLSYAFRRHVLRRRVPGTAIIALTFECQCRCACCSSDLFKEHYRGKAGMSGAEIFSWIDRIADAGAPRLHFTGGETALHPLLPQAVAAASRRGLVVFVESNGVALDEAAVLSLRGAGVSCVNVSLDSADPAVHDALRALPGCHRKAVAALRLCVGHGVPCLVSTYATRENIRDGGLAGVLALARELGCSGVRLLAPMPSGAWLRRGDVLLGPEDLRLVRALLPAFYPVLDRTPLIRCPLRSGYKIFVLPDGRLAPCEHLPYVFADSRGLPLDRLAQRVAGCPEFATVGCCLPRDEAFRRERLEPLAGGAILPL